MALDARVGAGHQQISPLPVGKRGRGTLGKPVEGMPLEEFHSSFGSAGATQYAPVGDQLGLITGDMQITLYTAEGFSGLRCASTSKGSPTIPASSRTPTVAGCKGRECNRPRAYSSRLRGAGNEQPALFVTRASGQTTIKALTSMPSLDARLELQYGRRGTEPRARRRTVRHCLLLDPLELRSLIAEVATDLYELRNWDIRAHQERIWAKYPGF